MERLIILDFSTGEVDIYPVEYEQEPDMDELLEALGHDANECQWMFSGNNITFHKEILKKEDESKTTDKNSKKSITKEQAIQILWSYIDNNELGDRFYELAQDLCNKAIQDIESKFIIVDIDGTPYTDSDDVMWYDECRDEFMKAVFEKIRAGQF